MGEVEVSVGDIAIANGMDIEMTVMITKLYPLGPHHFILEPGCLPAGHIILGENKDISAYSPGEQVFSEVGLTEVINKFERDYTGETYEIKPRGCLSFIVTPEHPILIQEVRIKQSKELRQPRRICFGLKWKPASELRPMVGVGPARYAIRDYLVFPKLKTEIRPSPRELEYGKSPPNRYGRVTLPLDDPNFAELLGIYVAEGSSTIGYPPTINLGTHEKELISHTRNLISQTLPYKSWIRTRGSSTEVNWGGQPLARFLRKEFGADCYSKHIPDWMLLAPIPILQRFLKGLWEGDGCDRQATRRGGTFPEFEFVAVTTSSEVLGLQVQLAFSKLGVFLGISKDEREGNQIIMRNRLVHIRNRWTVRAASYHPIFASFGLQQPYRENSQRKHYLEDELNFYVPITQIKKKQMFSGKVYNLQTNAENYLVSNIIVHNCGSGKLSMNLVTRCGCNATLIDNDPKALYRSSQILTVVNGLRGGHMPVAIREGDIRHIGFLDDTFHLVFSEGVIEHAQPPSSIVKEMIRVSKDAIIVMVPNATNAKQTFLANDQMEKYKDRPEHWAHYEKPMTQEEVRAMLEDELKLEEVFVTRLWPEPNPPTSRDDYRIIFGFGRKPGRKPCSLPNAEVI